MEALAVKLGILAGLFGFMGLVGLAALLGSVIWLIIRVSNLDSILPALICVLLSIGLTVGGLFLSPTPEARVEPIKMPWEMVLDWIVERRGCGQEDAEPAEDEPADTGGEGTSPEEEAADAAGASGQRRNQGRAEE